MSDSPAPTLLATGFVSDNPEEGTIFPSAGGNSGNPKVQAIYWRCLTVFFASARINNPVQRLALFSNVRPPAVDGVDIARILEKYGVELHQTPLTARLHTRLTPMWGNVLYFFDIMRALERSEPSDLRFALTDSDVLVAGPVAPLFQLLDDHDYAGIVIDTEEDENVNGLNRRQLGRIVAELGGSGEPPRHFGGELFATTLATWERDAPLYHRMIEAARSGSGAAAGIRTEEHIFSVILALPAMRVANADAHIKRIWTGPHRYTVAPGDERLPMWHLPAEKRLGFLDLFNDLHQKGFPTAMDPAEFNALAGRRCGVPTKSALKFTRDSARLVAAKLGLRP